MSTYYPENASPQQPGSYYDDRSADGSGYPVDDERNYNPNDNDEPPFDDNHPASNDVYSTNQHTIDDDDDDYPGRMETNQDLDIHDERRAYPDEGSHYHDDPTRPPSIHDPYGDDQYSRSYADDSYYSGRTGSTSSSRRYRRKEMGEEKEGCCHNCCPCPYGPLIVVPMFFVCAAVMCTYYSAFECTFFQVSGLFKRDITLTYGLWTTEQYDQFKIGRTEVQAAGLHIGTANTCVMWNNHPSLTMDDLDGPLKIGRNLVILACALAVINMIWIFVATRRMYSNCMVGVFIILMIVTAIFQACTFVSLNSSYCQNLSEGEVCSLDFAGYISIVACIFWLFAACATALLRRKLREPRRRRLRRRRNRRSDEESDGVFAAPDGGLPHDPSAPMGPYSDRPVDEEGRPPVDDMDGGHYPPPEHGYDVDVVYNEDGQVDGRLSMSQDGYSDGTGYGQRPVNDEEEIAFHDDGSAPYSGSPPYPENDEGSAQLT